ncbi:hypothetical protein Trydic_g15708 [Trypoxylus dichotomus]
MLQFLKNGVSHVLLYHPNPWCTGNGQASRSKKRRIHRKKRHMYGNTTMKLCLFKEMSPKMMEQEKIRSKELATEDTGKCESNGQ